MYHQKAKYYQDSVDALRKVFYRLNLILIGEAAIRFIDPEVFRLCLPMWDVDGDGFISVAEAKKIQRFAQNTFNGNDKITTLDDLDKFSNGYIYHSGSFTDMPNLVTASTGLKINLTSGLPDTFTAGYGNCPKLERIRINEHITEIPYNTFVNDISLKTIIWGGNEITIGQSAFKGCSGLEDIELPAGVKSIDHEAFRNCTSLRKINLENIKIIGGAVFQGCSNLEMDVDMPLAEGEISQVFSSSGIVSASNLGKITSVTYFAFSCPNLSYVVLPDTLTIIGNACFYDSKALEYIICNAVTPPTLDGSAFNGTSCIVYVPDASVAAYKSATNWNRIVSRIKPISEKS